MKRYLGVEAPEDAANSWRRRQEMGALTGWRILSKPGREDFLGFSGLTKIDKRIRLAADERCAALRRLCELLGKVVPDWWTSGWLNALISRGTSALKSEMRKGGNGWQRRWPLVAKVP